MSNDVLALGPFIVGRPGRDRGPARRRGRAGQARAGPGGQPRRPRDRGGAHRHDRLGGRRRGWHAAGPRVRGRLRRRRPDDVPGPHLRRHRRAHDRVRAGLSRSPRAAAGGVLDRAPVRDDRRDADRRLGRPADPVHRPRAHGPARLHARGLPQVRRLLDRGRDQVLPARLVQLGHLPVRARIRLGDDRHDQHRGRPYGAGSHRGGHESRFAGADPRARLPDHRRGLQDRRGPVPLLDAGRIPGLADAGHRLPLGRPQGRRVRPDPAAVRGHARAAARRTGSRSSSCSRS